MVDLETVPGQPLDGGDSSSQCSWKRLRALLWSRDLGICSCRKGTVLPQQEGPSAVLLDFIWKQKILGCESGETLARDIWRSCGCPILVAIQSQAGAAWSDRRCPCPGRNEMSFKVQKSNSSGILLFHCLPSVDGAGLDSRMRLG